MSAFVVSKEHIDALVSVAVYGPRDAESQWRGPSWSRECEPYEVIPESGYMSTTRWYSVAQGGLAELRKGGQEITGDELGLILWFENVASVRYRYPNDEAHELPGTYADNDTPEFTQGYTFERTGHGRMPTTVEALKLISCLDYQSCEHPAWRTSEACRILESLKDCLIGVLAGYGAAPWEWSAQPAR